MPAGKGRGDYRGIKILWDDKMNRYKERRN